VKAGLKARRYDNETNNDGRPEDPPLRQRNDPA
jgi:hypothetical protein